MSLLISVLIITTIFLLPPSTTISAIFLCLLLLYLAYMFGVVRFNHSSEFHAIRIPEPLREIENQKKSITRLARHPTSESDEDYVKEGLYQEVKERDKSQSPSVTLAREPFLCQPVTDGPPAAGYPIQVLHNHEDANLE